MLIIIYITSGCAPTPRWIESYEPTTDAERKAVAETVEKIISATPKTLSGDDQDWDDAISEATRSDKTIHCRKVMLEFNQPEFFGNWSKGGYTGRWKYADELKIKQNP